MHTEPTAATFVELLTQFRHDRHMNQTQAAEALGVMRRTYVTWEHGTVPHPNRMRELIERIQQLNNAPTRTGHACACGIPARPLGAIRREEFVGLCADIFIAQGCTVITLRKDPKDPHRPRLIIQSPQGHITHGFPFNGARNHRALYDNIRAHLKDHRHYTYLTASTPSPANAKSLQRLPTSRFTLMAPDAIAAAISKLTPQQRTSLHRRWHLTTAHPRCLWIPSLAPLNRMM